MSTTIRRALIDAAKDGQISLQELQDVVKQFGSRDVAKAMAWAYDSYVTAWTTTSGHYAQNLAKAFGVALPHVIERTRVRQLAKAVSSEATFVLSALPKASRDEVAQQVLPNTGTPIDVRRTGQIDADTLLYSCNLSGCEITRVGEALGGRLAFQRAIVAAAQAFDAAPHEFGLITNEDPTVAQAFSSTFWEHPEYAMRGKFKVKDGVKPSDAIADVLTHPDAYRFECATALVLIYYTAVLKVLGPAAFDAKFPGLEAGPWESSPALAPLIEYQGKEAIPISPEARAALVPGDYVYFMNPEVSPAGLAAGWRGENAIYLGGDLFFGHPFGITTGAKIIEHLNEFRVPGSTTSAYLASSHHEPQTEALIDLIQ